ncbi:hypothetical protein [uncultured Gammaproteobacteria bacterium]|nr:hypothetical protein [uncultured Gammaproteobacteria bacterium]CAC9637201.1 hypothetical protein [uncultured Gammaproteobacteria bacterium]
MCFHPTGKAVFWLKPLYQLGFVFFLISIFEIIRVSVQFIKQSIQPA